MAAVQSAPPQTAAGDPLQQADVSCLCCPGQTAEANEGSDDSVRRCCFFLQWPPRQKNERVSFTFHPQLPEFPFTCSHSRRSPYRQANRWFSDGLFAAVCLALQVITPGGQIYSASWSRTMVPWTRTGWTSAVSGQAEGFLNFYIAAVNVCVCVCVLSCVQSCRIIQRAATAFRQTWHVWSSTCRMFLWFLQTWPGCKSPLTLITWPDSVFPQACCDSWCVKMYPASAHSVYHRSPLSLL